MTALDPALYAPQARLVDLASGTIIGTNVSSVMDIGANTTETTTVVSADLISVRVTLINTGVAQLQVTLNNQRFVEGKPVFPPWKYNDFSARAPGGSTQDSAGTYALTFGQRIRLDLRYANGPWVKMIAARVTNLQFTFPAGGAAQVVVTAEDMLSALKVKPERDVAHDNKQEEAIARDTVSTAGVTIPVRTNELPERAQPLRSARHQQSQTYFQFLTEIADRLDCELHVDFVDRRGEDDERGTVGSGAIDVANELVIVMEPARSKQLPTTKVSNWRAADLADGEYLELRRGVSMIDFSPTLKVWEMPTSSALSGSHPDRRGRARGRITSANVRAAIELELPPSPAYDVEPVDAVSARNQFFGEAGDGDTNAEAAHGSGLDETRTRIKALAQIMKKVREFMTAEASTIGVPALRPGVYVHVIGMRPPFDGFFYVTKTVHSLDSNGYRTQLSLRRPGMLPPDAYFTRARGEPESTAGGAS